jgi:hypothetical protein
MKAFIECLPEFFWKFQDQFHFIPYQSILSPSSYETQCNFTLFWKLTLSILRKTDNINKVICVMPSIFIINPIWRNKINRSVQKHNRNFCARRIFVIVISIIWFSPPYRLQGLNVFTRCRFSCPDTRTWVLFCSSKSEDLNTFQMIALKLPFVSVTI